SSYNSGFAFVSFIARTYGEDKLAEISRNLSTLTEVTIGGAIGRALGRSGEEVYNEWKSAVAADYNARIAKVRENLREGIKLRFLSEDEFSKEQERNAIQAMRSPAQDALPPGAQRDRCGLFDMPTGFANLYPTYSPDGTKLAYVSAKEADYFSQSGLFVINLISRKEKLIEPGVRTAPAWSPDGQTLFYAKATRDNPHWSYQFDIYSYSLATKKETRITHGRRALSPTVSPDGTHIAYVVNSDGTTNLAVANADGSGERVITPYQSGEQVYNPKWSPSGDRIIFDYSIKDGRSIAEIRPDGGGLHFLVSGDEDSRTGTFSPGGLSMLYSSDRTGIFNLYIYDFATGSSRQLTNVMGGAFCPTWDSTGDIVYAGYTSGGYKLFLLENPGILPDRDQAYVRLARGAVPGTGSASARVTTPQFDWMRLRTYDDTHVPQPAERDYKSTFTSLSFVPFLRIDNYTYNSQRSSAADVIKPGVYLFSNDVLEKTGFFAGAALNRNFERDLFLQFFYRSKIPLLYDLGLEPVASAEIYNVTRKTSSSISLPDVPYIPVQVEYDLLEFDFALNQPFLSQFGNAELRYAHSRYTSILQDFINPETNSLAIGTSDLYLIANTITLKFTLDATVPSRTEEINPVGRRLAFAIGRELNKFNGDGQYEVTPSGLRPIYKPVNFTRVQGTWREFIPLFFRDNTLTATLNGEAIISPPVDEFFDFYAGGLTGMKGYPFYSISGNRGVTAGLTYRFPISNNLDFRLLPIYFDKLYLAAYGDVGNTWTDNASTIGGWVSDAGLELRLESWSFYSYPTRFFLNASYGFNEFNRFIRSENSFVTYGKQVRLYFGVLFGFDFD
ncbi:MAG TPA: biopolymer transporter Tol, partial [Bacteroidota bacterium]|nr:biopolymer transporter Tol [Bacteroidota bacterium]